MPYATADDFRQAFSESEFDELTGGDDAQFVSAEAGAASLIEGFIGTRYKLPLVYVPAIVKRWALDLARYNLWDQRSPEEVRLRRDEAMEQLEMLSKGTITLPPDVNGVEAASQINVAFYSAERQFTADTLARF